MREARRLILAAAVVALLPALPAAASLVIFEDGAHLYALDFEVEHDNIKLFLDGGATMTLPLDRISRIVDDEYDRSVPEPPVVAAEPGRSVRRSERPAGLKTQPFDEHILAAAKEHRIDPALIAAVIRAESGFAPKAVSRKGARGLMQLMPATAKRLGVKRVFDPLENIRGGTAYLAELAERYGDTAVELILAAYNAGERAVAEYDGIPPYRETREYVRRVTSLWNSAHETSAPAAGGVVAAAGG